MKKKGEKLPSVNVEGESDAVVEVRDGKVVKVCPHCRAVLDRETGACPEAASHADGA